MQRIEKKWPKAQRIHAIESLLSNIVKVVEDCQNSQKVEEQNCQKKSNIDKHCRNSKKWS